MLNHIVIIGVGNIGSKYLKGLLTLKRNTILTVIDTSLSSIQKAKQIYKQSINNEFILKVNFLRSLDLLKDNVFLAIVSTNSDVRYKIIINLFKKVSVNFMIIEKVAFQSNEQFKKIINLTKNNNCIAWLNCMARLFPIYKKIKKEMINDKKIYFNVSAGNFFLGSNSIHIIDLFLFISNQLSINLNCKNLEKNIYKSKRKNFLELAGTLTGKSTRGDILNITSYHNSNLPFLLTVISKNQQHLVTYQNNKLILQSCYYKKNWSIFKSTFKIPMTSKVLTNVTRNIIDHKNCSLPSLEKSFVYHKSMISSFTRHINKYSNIKYSKCPIT